MTLFESIFGKYGWNLLGRAKDVGVPEISEQSFPHRLGGYWDFVDGGYGQHGRSCSTCKRFAKSLRQTLKLKYDLQRRLDEVSDKTVRGKGERTTLVPN